MTDIMESTNAARSAWASMGPRERHEAAHAAIDIAVCALEHAVSTGTITRTGADSAITLLGVACATTEKDPTL